MLACFCVQYICTVLIDNTDFYLWDIEIVTHFTHHVYIQYYNSACLYVHNLLDDMTIEVVALG